MPYYLNYFTRRAASPGRSVIEADVRDALKVYVPRGSFVRNSVILQQPSRDVLTLTLSLNDFQNVTLPPANLTTRANPTPNSELALH